MSPLLFSRTHFLLWQLVCLTLSRASPNIHLRSATTSTVANIETVTVTSLIPAPTGQLDSTYTNYSDFIFAVLNSTNLYRYEHDTPAVTWNESLAAWSADYASQCAAFAHSGRDGVGENIVSGAADVTSAIDLFGDERSKYDYDNPGFSESTGHFTQLVWKETLSTGCGAAYCNDPNKSLYGVFMVCQYYPPGNMNGGQSYSDNVPPQANNGQGYEPEEVKVAYSGGVTVTATNTMGPQPTGSNMMGEAVGIVDQSPRRMLWAAIATVAALALASGMT